METLLDIRGLHVNYGGIQALHNVNMSVRAGEVVLFPHLRQTE
jgi:ABC-type branched-subunit amino acid transport system ATPase component